MSIPSRISLCYSFGMKNILLASLIALSFIGSAASVTQGADTIITNEEKQKQCFAMCPGFGSDEYVECFKEKCALLFDQEGEDTGKPGEEWKQIAIKRTEKTCIAPEGGNEQFYIMVSRTPTRDFGTQEVQAGILNPGDRFEIPAGNDWSVWLKGTQGTLINLTGDTVMQTPCIEEQSLPDRVWTMLKGAGFFNFENPAFVDTRTAVAGVKGTQFVLTSEETKSDLYVTEGTVSLKAKNGNEVLVEASQFATASIISAEEAQPFSALPSSLAQLGSTTTPGNTGGSSNTFSVLALLALGIGGYWFWKRKRA